jgi:uncharacterized BrkB/YihY/UPF0761 family membrane protein
VYRKLKTVLRRLWRTLRPTFRYWMQTEVHTYAFAIAANVLLSFYPFLNVMVSLCRGVLHWPEGVEAIHLAISDFFPDTFTEFVGRNFPRGGRVPLISLALLLFTANGIFTPLEVAFNRAWRITKDRNYLHNQAIAFGLIFGCGTLALLSITLTALNQASLSYLFGTGTAKAVIGGIAFKFAAMPLAILALFFVYWLLPNGRPPISRVIPAAIVVGILLELLKYTSVLIWPWFFEKLSREYEIFKYSASLILLSFFAAMLVLAGAEWSARRPEVPCPLPLSPEPPRESAPPSPESSPPAVMT